MKSLFRCPVCGGPLDREERVYRCADRHSYDIAKEGYTYLLPPNQKHSADPGDDKAMSAARRDFLSKKYYAPLLNTLCSRILPLVGEHPVQQAAALADRGSKVRVIMNGKLKFRFQCLHIDLIMSTIAPVTQIYLNSLQDGIP